MKRTPLLALSLVAGCMNSGLESYTPPPNPGGPDGGPSVQCLDEYKTTYYADTDGDGYGDAEVTAQACESSPGWVDDNTDCNDSMAAAHPGAIEMCGDKIDNDCAGGDPCVGNLTAHWGFDDLAGPSVLDESGNNIIGVLQGGLINIPDSMLSFDGIDDYVEVADVPLFQLPVGTVSFWFKPAIIGPQQSMLSKDSSGNDAGGHLSFYLDPDGTVRVRLQSNNESYEIRTLAPVAAAQWHNVVFTFGGNEGMSLYVNGELAGKDPYTGGLLRNYEPLAIGVGTDQSGDLTAQPISFPFQGQISDVQIYDRQLLIDELTGLRMTSAPDGYTPPAPPPPPGE